MKKAILVILVCGILLMVTGCKNNSEKETENLTEVYNQINEYFNNENVDRTNLGSVYIDEENNVIVVELIDNSTENQEEFIKNTNVNSKYIRFEQGGPYVISGIDFYISKPEFHNDIQFNDYYTNNDRTIYLAGNIDEFYIIDSGTKMTLKSYLSTANQSFENSIQSITNKLTLIHSHDDGGTSVYKNEAKDITVIVCNTLDQNKDIFIGDYSMNFDSASMCK